MMCHCRWCTAVPGLISPPSPTSVTRNLPQVRVIHLEAVTDPVDMIQGSGACEAAMESLKKQCQAAAAEEEGEGAGAESGDAAKHKGKNRMRYLDSVESLVRALLCDEQGGCRVGGLVCSWPCVHGSSISLRASLTGHA
jgi:hypothetical protein